MVLDNTPGGYTAGNRTQSGAMGRGPTSRPIDSSPIEAIKERLSIVDIVGQRVELKKSGKSFKGCCPFHNEKTPSFHVFPDKGNYHCFGCGANGDIFTFIEKTENLDFTEALRTLAEKAGVELQSRRETAVVQERIQRIYDMNEQAARFYHNILRAPAGAEGLAYLRKRALTDESLERYLIGFAPQNSDLLLKYLTTKGYSREEIVQAGLAAEREQGTRDLFWSRVLFPIRNEKGHIMGFGGRTLGDGQPKYLNTPATPAFDKGASLYGIEVARDAIREKGEAIIVEGYLDVLMAHQNGINNVIAALGTALSDRQLGTLKRLCKKIVLALDPDSAGRKAAVRGLEIARQVYGEDQPTISPKGLVRLESRMSADLRIATLPDGLDPDELIRKSADEFRAIIASARPTVDFYLDLVLGEADLKTASGTAEAIEKILPIIAELPGDVERSYYIDRLAQRTGISASVLTSEVRKNSLKKGARVVQPEPLNQALIRQKSKRSGEVFDLYYIELIIQAVLKLGRVPEGISAEELFVTEAREAHLWIVKHFEEGKLDFDVLLANPPDDLPEPIYTWLRERSAGGYGAALLFENDLEQEIDRVLREIRRRNLRQRSEQLGELLRQAAQETDGAQEITHNYVRAAEAILTQLQPYELGSTYAGAWRGAQTERRGILPPPAPPEMLIEEAE